jgi:hypothetical protein
MLRSLKSTSYELRFVVQEQILPIPLRWIPFIVN